MGYGVVVVTSDFGPDGTGSNPVSPTFAYSIKLLIVARVILGVSRAIVM